MSGIFAYIFVFAYFRCKWNKANLMTNFLIVSYHWEVVALMINWDVLHCYSVDCLSVQNV
jgi:hypothetical protein